MFEATVAAAAAVGAMAAHMASYAVLGGLAGCAICCWRPDCRTSCLRGAEALFGLAFGVWSLALLVSGVGCQALPAKVLYCCLCFYMGLDTTWMLCSFNGIRLGWFGLGRHALTCCCLALLATATPEAAQGALATCGYLYLSTDLLLVFEHDFCANPSRQTAAPWLFFMITCRLPQWLYCVWAAYSTPDLRYLVPVFVTLATLDASAAASKRMTRWFGRKYAAASAARPPNMWVSFLELLQIVALYGRKTARGSDTRARLNAMYSLSSEEYDKSRQYTLFGRSTLVDLVVTQAEARLAAARATGLKAEGALGVWVDIGGGTAENLAFVAERLDLSVFRRIYVVDYSDRMCEHARARVAARGWSNVTVVRADAAAFVPLPEEGPVSFVTMSYSLSMIPGYARLINTIAGYANSDTAVVVADFFTSHKNDSSLRQHEWWRRWGMRAWFSIDDVDLAPHRRDVCEQVMQLVWESNHKGPLLNKSLAKLLPHVPYYVAVYMLPSSGDASGGGGPAERNGLWAATRYISPDLGKCDWVAVPNFLYSYAIEDPLVDGKFLDLRPSDSLLLLTTGGDNVLHWLPKVAHVTAVDMNQHQNALLELKFAAIVYSGLPLREVQDWLERGSHPDVQRLLTRTLPHMSAEARQYWVEHAHMFEEIHNESGGMNGLYMHGSYGLVLAATRLLCKWLGMTQQLGKGDSHHARMAVAKSSRYRLVKWVLTHLCHPTLIWPLMGIPTRQYERIAHGQSVHDFVANSIDGTFVWTPWETNYFSYAFAMGRFSRTCHPDYLDRSNLEAMRAIPRADLRSRLTIATAPYSEAMQTRGYSRMIFSDHLDWLSDDEVREFAREVKRALLPGGLASFRSAALVAGYAKAFEEAGLQCERVATHNGAGMDRLNSYASFYLIRQTGDSRAPLSGTS